MATILIVDDSSMARRNLKNILISEGHTVVAEATNGVQAFVEYEKQLFIKTRKFAFFIVLSCLVSLLSLNWAFHPIIISFRFGLLLILMIKFYQIIFSLRQQITSKIFILLALLLILERECLSFSLGLGHYQKSFAQMQRTVNPAKILVLLFITAQSLLCLRSSWFVALSFKSIGFHYYCLQHLKNFSIFSASFSVNNKYDWLLEIFPFQERSNPSTYCFLVSVKNMVFSLSFWF